MGRFSWNLVVSRLILASIHTIFIKTIQRAGSGFKVNVANLKSLALNLGNHSTTPFLSVGVSVDYEPFFTVNISEGRNVIPLTGQKSFDLNSVVRVNVEGWQNNRMNLESIEVNQVCITQSRSSCGIDSNPKYFFLGCTSPSVHPFSSCFPIHR